MLGEIVSTSRHAYVGQSGTGKSFAAKKAIAAFLAAKGSREQAPRVLVIDPEDEWSKLGKKTDKIDLGPCTTRATFEQFADDPARYLDHERFACAVVVSSSDPCEASQQVAEIIDHVLATGDVVTVFEECGAYTGPDVDDAEAYDKMSMLATRGRKYGCPVVFCAQRLVQIPKTARSQITEMQLFTQIERSDLNALAEMAGPRGAEVVRLNGTRRRVESKELPGAVSMLADREFAVWRRAVQTQAREER